MNFIASQHKVTVGERSTCIEKKKINKNKFRLWTESSTQNVPYEIGLSTMDSELYTVQLNPVHRTRLRTSCLVDIYKRM